MILYGRILVRTKSCEILVKRQTVQGLAHLLCARNGANLTFIYKIKCKISYMYDLTKYFIDFQSWENNFERKNWKVDLII